MFKGLTELFIFTKSERKGVVSLVVLILLVFGAKQAYKYYLSKQAYDYTEIEKKIAELEIQKVDQESEQLLSNADTIHIEKLKLNKVDPNTASKSDLMRIGLSEKQAIVLINYRQKGGRFRKISDVRKIYSIDDEVFNRIVPYLIVKEKQGRNVNQDKSGSKNADNKGFDKASSAPKVARKSIEINSADTTLLMTISGIGSYYAKNIVKYRELLGGYYAYDQLKEVYGLRDRPEAIEKITPYMTLDTGLVHRINVNTCDRETLKSHPYIKWAVANSIVSIRETHGLFKNIADLQKSDLVDHDLYSKIAPYLKVNDD